MNETMTPAEALENLRGLTKCRCHSAFKDRGMEDPECNCDYAEDVEALAALAQRVQASEREWQSWEQAARTSARISGQYAAERDAAIVERNEALARAEAAEARAAELDASNRELAADAMAAGRRIEAAEAALALARQDAERYREQAVSLWMLLDAIDTEDDACRANDALYRKVTRNLQRGRFNVMTGEDFDAAKAAIDALLAPADQEVRDE